MITSHKSISPPFAPIYRPIIYPIYNTIVAAYTGLKQPDSNSTVQRSEALFLRKKAGLGSLKVLEEEDMGRLADDMTWRLNFMDAKKKVASGELL